MAKSNHQLPLHFCKQIVCRLAFFALKISIPTFILFLFSAQVKDMPWWYVAFSVWLCTVGIHKVRHAFPYMIQQLKDHFPMQFSLPLVPIFQEASCMLPPISCSISFCSWLPSPFPFLYHDRETCHNGKFLSFKGAPGIESRTWGREGGSVRGSRRL